LTEERFDEKEVQKHEEKWDEKYREDLVSRLVGAAFLIWLGVVLLADNLEFLTSFTSVLDRLSIKPYSLPFEIPFVNPNALQIFFLGAGLILMLEIIVRLLLPIYRKHMLGTIIGAVAFFALGLGTWTIVGPLILIAVGAYILLGGLFRRR
jgi:hypothetical protein